MLFVLVRVLTFFPMRYYKRWVSTVRSANNNSDDAREMAVLIRKTIRRFRRHFMPDATCLVKSVVAKRMLAKRGIGSILYIGVKKQKEKLAAHAWVICNNEPVVDDADVSDYTVMTTL